MTTQTHTPGPHISAKDAAAHAFAEVDRLKEANADLVEALKGSLQFVVLWRHEYAKNQPQTAHDSAMLKLIGEQLAKSEAALKKAGVTP